MVPHRVYEEAPQNSSINAVSIARLTFQQQHNQLFVNYTEDYKRILRALAIQR